MKRMLRYPELWQKKRAELPVKNNADAGWQQMCSMLDQQMPVQGAAAKKPSRFKIPKWGLHVFAGVSLIAAVYVGNRLYHTAKYHDTAKPGTRQMLHDSLAPAVNDTLFTPGNVKPAARAPGSTPAIIAPDTSFSNPARLNNGPAPQHGQQATDRAEVPVNPDAPAHHDSLLAPAEISSRQAVRDSAGPVKDLQKDTSAIIIKTPKIKKRVKLNVFF